MSQDKDSGNMVNNSNVVTVRELQYSYHGKAPVLNNCNFDLSRGERCLLVGINGAGKSTFLRIVGGKQLVRNCEITVLGCKAYSQTPDGLCFLDSAWATNPLVRRDVVVRRLLTTLNAQLHEERVNKLIEILEVDTEWHMHAISDGQRRRVQLLLGLMAPFQLLLMDEVTTELDVIVRTDLLAYLKNECETRGASIVFATHIFDGLGDWATHLCHMSNGTIRCKSPLGEIEELKELCAISSYGHSPLLKLIEKWLRAEAKEKKAMDEDTTVDSITQKNSLGRMYGDKYYNYWNRQL